MNSLCQEGSSGERSYDTRELNFAMNNIIQSKWYQFINEVGNSVAKEGQLRILYNYENDHLRTVVFIDSQNGKQVGLVEFSYGSVGGFIEVPISININGFRLGLRTHWEKIADQLSRVQEKIGYFQLSMPFQGIADINRVDFERVKKLENMVLDAIKDPLTSLAQELGEVLSSQVLPRLAPLNANKMSQDTSQLKINFSVAGGGVTVEPSISAEKKPETLLPTFRHRIIQKIGNGIFWITFGLVAAKAAWNGYQYATADSYYYVHSSISVAPYLISLFGLGAAKLINLIPLYFDNFGARFGRQIGYWSFTEMFLDILENWKVYKYQRRQKNIEMRTARQQHEELKISQDQQESEAQKTDKIELGKIEVSTEKGDLTKVKADALVVPQFSSENSAYSGGVARALGRRYSSGIKAYDQILKSHFGQVPFYSAHLVESGGEGARFIIHVVSVASSEHIDESEQERRTQFGYETMIWSMVNVFRKAIQNNVKSMAVPAMGTGVLGELKYAKQLSSLAILEAVQIIRQEFPDAELKVRIVPYEASDAVASLQAFKTFKKSTNSVPKSSSRSFTCSELF